MKTSPVGLADVGRSVWAVPPLARHPDLRPNPDANRKLIRHLEQSGVSTLLYGGNANFYNIGLYEYAEVVDLLAESAAPESWVIPSVGPDFGKMMDQAAVLKSRSFPTAMVLPLSFPVTEAGVEGGIRRLADALARPVIVYLKSESYLSAAAVGRLVDAGVVAAVKYAIARPDPRQDPFLRRLVETMDPGLVVSGMGERPAIVHLHDFGLAGYTSGAVCIAPRGAARFLAAMQARDWAAAETLRAAYLAIEDLRDAHSPIRVLHAAVALAEIAETGPMLPLLSDLEGTLAGPVRDAARQLLLWDRR
jgi:dihydrodipicolinate synthase/N-acetylneuraminate lyase